MTNLFFPIQLGNLKPKTALLWHVGRLSDPSFLNGATPVSASTIAADGHPSYIRSIKPYDVPHALSSDETQQIILDYRQAAINAKQAGFDCVEIQTLGFFSWLIMPRSCLVTAVKCSCTHNK